MFDLKLIWKIIRNISGDDAYEVYLKHYKDCEKNKKNKLLSRQEFYVRKLEEKWSGINRCC
jgi:uncharacterized short protein YbdD (DUF466 family)